MIPAPHLPERGITVYYVIEGKVELRLPTPDGGTRPCWWLQATAYATPRAAPPDSRALVLVCKCPVHVPHGTPPPPPVQVCIKRGDRYTSAEAARQDLGGPQGNPHPTRAVTLGHH